MSDDEAGGGESGSNWPRTLGAIAGVLTALAGLIGAVRSCSTGEKKGPSDVATQTAAPAVPTAPVATPQKVLSPRRQLLWVPSDCAGETNPAVAVDSCADRRTMEWLKLEMSRLRRDGSFGFGALPANFALMTGDYGDSGINYKLAVRRTGVDQDLFVVGVGYNRALNAKDGALRLYRDRTVVAEAWLRADGTWSDVKGP